MKPLGLSKPQLSFLRLSIFFIFFVHFTHALPLKKTKTHSSLNGPAITPLIGTRMLEGKNFGLVRHPKLIDSGNNFDVNDDQQGKEGDEEEEDEDGIYIELYPLTITKFDSDRGSSTIESFVCETYTVGALECVRFDDFTNVVMFFYGDEVEDDSYTSFFISEIPNDITTTNYLQYHRSYEALRGTNGIAGATMDELGDCNTEREGPGVYGEYELYLSVDTNSGETFVCDHSPQCAPFSDFTNVYVSAFGHEGYTELFQGKVLLESETIKRRQVANDNPITISENVTTLLTSLSQNTLASSLLTYNNNNTLTISSDSSSSSTVLFLESQFNAHDPPGLSGSNLVFGFLSVVFLGLLV